MQVKDYMEYWYKTYRAPYQQQNTREVTWSLIRNHILDSSLGKISLREVTTRDCQEFLTNEILNGRRRADGNGEGLSYHSSVKLRQLLIAMCRQAVKEGLMARNVAEDTETISIPWKETSIFTPDEQRQFLHATQHDRFYVAYVMFFFLGCVAQNFLDFRGAR